MKRYVSASLSKRLGAFLLDIFTIVFLATILYSLFGRMLVKTSAFSQATQIMNEILVESNLFEYDEKDHNNTLLVKEENYDVAIEKYYIEYKKNEELYHEKMQESNLFNYVDGSYVKKEGVSDEAVLTFYQGVIGEAIIEVKNNENYQFCYKLNMNFVLYNLIVSLMISYFTFILLIPILMKNKVTIGQRIMNFALVNSETNELASKTQIIIRSIIIFIIEGVISIFSLGLPVIVSMIFIIMNKEKCSYHDILSSTKLIDYHYVEIDDERNVSGLKEK